MTKLRGHICIRRKAKDGAAGAAGKTIRNTVWKSGKKYFAGDTLEDGVYPLDIVSDKAMAIGTTGVNFYMCIRTHESSSSIPLTNTSYWAKLNNLKPVVTYLILAEAIKASFIDVDDLAAATAFINALTANNTFTETLAATTAFINKLLATSAFIDNLSVKHLNGADGKFSGVLSFPFVDIIENSTFDYSTGGGQDMYYTMHDNVASVSIKYSDRYYGSPYSSTSRYNHFTLPSMPSGTVLNIVSDANNYKNTARPVYFSGSIYYGTNPEGSSFGSSLLHTTEICVKNTFFIRMMCFGGNWYIISIMGEFTAN